ncbi:DUF262 domain-containing protein [Planctomycetales bacterium 10988]|nr:DUF262 domain-containing protein [Planctomycetales bacterium 10988]
MPDDTTDNDLSDLNEEQLNPPDTLEVEEAADPVGEEYYPVEYAISSYGADYPVDGLVKRINAGSIYIPMFQRSFVWNVYRASRFIESLLLGLPVPAVFLSRELDSNKMLVIDGQQRLRTLQYFYNGVFEPTDRAFRLLGVHERFVGKTYDTLSEDDRLRLDDSIIHAIIVKQESPDDGEDAASPSSAYHIFERLNTGGVLLQPQEIRSCIYHGPLVELLETLNTDENWRALFGNISTRMRDRELILRFLALYRLSDQYSKPMKEFLNRFAARYRTLDATTAQDYSDLFGSTVSLIRSAVGDRAFKTKSAINAALYDAVMVGVARRLESGPVSDGPGLKTRYETLLKDEEFIHAISSGTTDESNVKVRLSKATEVFRDVP